MILREHGGRVGTLRAYLEPTFATRGTRKRSGRLDCDGSAIKPVTPRPIKEVAMLVLSRKLNEKIVIDGGIIITVVKIDRNQVRLGIEAPGHVPVYREEILPLAKQNHDAEQLAVCS